MILPFDTRKPSEHIKTSILRRLCKVLIKVKAKIKIIINDIKQNLFSLFQNSIPANILLLGLFEENNYQPDKMHSLIDSGLTELINQLKSTYKNLMR